MKWLARLLGWTVVLAVPCGLLYEPYQLALGAAVSRVLAAAGTPVDLARVNVGAPFDLGLFAAFCLASGAAPRAARGRALALGIPAMMVLEVALCALAIGTIALRRAAGAGPDDASVRAAFYLTDTIPWVSGGLLWLAFLGPWVLPAAHGPVPRPAARRAVRA